MAKDIYAVIGSPIFHSKSPIIYNTLFNIYNIDAFYLPIELNEETCDKFLDYAKNLNLKGINITMPLKTHISKRAKALDSASDFLQSTNTYDLKTGKGYTTDGKGFVASLDFSLKGKNVVLLGCGGAARSIAFELMSGGINRLTILNRNENKAANLVNSLQCHNNCTLAKDSMHFDSLSNIASHTSSCDLLINATSLGMGETDFDNFDFISTLEKTAFVYDIIYNPIETKLLSHCKNANIPCKNGIEMLICQAFFAFEIFTGIMPTDKDKETLLKVIHNS